MAQDTLVPSYTHVEKFANDDEYELNEDGTVDEEVFYVTLDVGQVEPTLVPSTSSYRLIGLDTPTPYLQLQGSIFKGEHHTLLGTELLFTDSKGMHEQQDCLQSQKSLTNIGTTESRIRFKEVEIKPKQPVPSATSAEQPNETSSSMKRRRPQTMDQLVGGDAAADPVTKAGGRGRGRGGRGRGRGRGGSKPRKSKGKEKAVDDHGGQAGVPASVEGVIMTTGDTGPITQETNTQWPATDPTGSDLMDVDNPAG